jgi:predicted MPP superfamily phosphohydrolase
MYFVNLLTCTALIDIVRLINLGAKFSSDDLHEIRKWWLLGSHILIALMFLIGWINFQFPRVVDFDLASCQLQEQARELRILLATDLHLGYYCGKARLWKWVKLMNDQHADLIVLGGDVGDNFYEPIAHQRLHEELSLLEAKYGVFAVSGNHEYHHREHDALEQYLRTNTHIRYLRDSSELIDNSFYVVGRDDRTNPDRLPVEALVRDLDRSKPVILIDHQPVELNEAEENGVTLELAGHTHAGQFFPVTIIVPCVFENSHGYSRRGNTHFVVSSGLGVWGPQSRLGSNSEIINIRLRY